MDTQVKIGEPAAGEEAEQDMGAPARARDKSWLIRLVSIIVVLIVWEIAGRRINPLFMSYPSAIVRAAITMIGTGELLAAVASSLRTLLVGFTTASVMGIVVGLLI